MKIVRTRGCFSNLESAYLDRLYRDYVLHILQNPFYQQKTLVDDHQPVLIVKVGRDNCIRNSRFILQAKKDKTIGSSRALARNDATGDAHPLAVAYVAQIDGTHDAHSIHLL